MDGIVDIVAAPACLQLLCDVVVTIIEPEHPNHRGDAAYRGRPRLCLCGLVYRGIDAVVDVRVYCAGQDVLALRVYRPRSLNVAGRVCKCPYLAAFDDDVCFKDADFGDDD